MKTHTNTYWIMLREILPLAVWLCVYAGIASAADLSYLLKLNTNGPTAQTEALDFSPDGKLLAAVGLDKTIRIWNLGEFHDSGTMPEPKTFHFFGEQGASGQLICIKFSPDGSVLAVGANTGRCYFLDPVSGKHLLNLSIDDLFASLAFSPDQRFLASGHRESITFWDLKEFWTLKQKSQLPAEEGQMLEMTDRLGERAQHVKCHPNGQVYSVSFPAVMKQPLRMVSAGFDSQPILWELSGTQWKQKQSLRDHGAPTVRAIFAPDGRGILTSGFSRDIRLWNEPATTYKVLGTASLDHLDVFYPPSIRFKGELVVAAAWPMATKCSVLRLSDGRKTAEFSLHDDSVTACAVSPTEDLVATAGGTSGEIYLWNPKSGELKAKIASPGTRLVSVAFSEDGKKLAYGTEHVDFRRLSRSEYQRYADLWDHGRDEYSTGLLRAHREVLRPLRHTFHLESLEQGPSIAPIEKASSWYGPQLELDGWEVDRYVSKQKERLIKQKGGGDSLGDNTLVIFRNGREVNRLTMKDDTNRISAASLVRLDESGRIGVVVASRLYLELYDADSKKFIRSFHGHSSEVMGVAVSPDQSLLASASSDQTIRIWSLRGLGAKQDVVQPILSIFPTRSGRSVSWTQQGYYAASPGSDSLFGWKVNHGIDRPAEFYTANSFQAMLYRPEIVKATLAARGRPEQAAGEITIEQLMASSVPPNIKFLSPGDGEVVSTRDVEVEMSITHPLGAAIDAIDLTINGQANRDVQVRPKLDGQTFRERVRLSKGKNILGVRAVMSGGVLSESSTLTIVCTAGDADNPEENQPDLILLAVGIADYPTDDLRLQYAAKDARDLAAAWSSQKGKRFRNVQHKVIVDREATREHIREGMAWLKSMKPRSQDFVMVFMAGHGGLDESENYSFLAVDSRIDQLEATGVRWADVRQVLSKSGGRPFLFLDTCHAGGAGPANATNSVRDAYNGLLRDAANDFSTGIITVASCLPHEESYEHHTWSNGAFTKSVVEAILGKGDLNQNGVLTISEMEAYVSQRLDELTDNRQSSCLFKTNSVPSNLLLVRTK